MDPFVIVWIFFLGIIAGVLAGITLVYKVAVNPLHKKVDRIKHEKQSLSTKYGQITEQYAPFMEKYPYNPKKFRFIGTPIDGIQFNPDKIIFVEFKTNDSKKSTIQQQIKKLVKQKKVEWLEFRIK